MKLFSPDHPQSLGTCNLKVIPILPTSELRSNEVGRSHGNLSLTKLKLDVEEDLQSLLGKNQKRMRTLKIWLMKTEPDVFSIDDLKRVGKEPWDGIRNYQARNFMRDEMKLGDRVLIYHSRSNPIGIVGEAEVASEPYPDPSQFDPKSAYFDAKSDPANPRWVLVDIRYIRHFPKMITMSDLKTVPGLEQMMVIRKGMRLSIQPVTMQEYQCICEWAG